MTPQDKSLVIINQIKEDSSKFWKLEDNKDSSFWTKEQKKRSIALFHAVAKKVPAYKDFLKKNDISRSKVQEWDEFQKIPFVSKENYLKRYPLHELCWEGDLKKPLVFTSTSGSTGIPFYFPRGNDLDWQYSLLIEEFLSNSLGKQKGPALVIICFGMGVWIGGLITYKAFEIAIQRLDASVSIITPGINKKEIFNSLKTLSPNYESTILVGYPPFMKDIIDEAPANDVNLKKLNIKLIFAAEAFTESFRDYLARRTNVQNVQLDTMNIYGTADIGAMAYETPMSILIRRLAVKNPSLFKDIFGPIDKTPTLAQFNPLFINFECIKGSIILTGNNAIPLVRYNVGDHGGVYSYDEIIKILEKHNINLVEEAKKTGIKHVLNELPFVFVFERYDFSVTLYGLQIYPEVIRETIIEEPFSEHLTGKFSMETKFSKKQDQYLELNIELQPHISSISKKMENQLVEKIVTNLRERNSEFRELSDYLKDRANPKLVFWPNENPNFFKPGIKQKWVKK